MAVNKVEFGGSVILDLTDATATPEAILTGFTAYGADGSKINGTAQGLNLTVVQSFSKPASPKENTLWIKKMQAGSWVIVEPSGLSMNYSSAVYNGIAIVGKLQIASPASSNLGVSLVDGESGINLIISDVQGGNNDPDTNQYGWCPLDCQLYKNGAWRNISYGAEGFLSVTYPVGSYCSIEDTKNGVKIESHDTSGHAYFSIPYEGDWVVSCYNSGQQRSSPTVSAHYDDVVNVTLSYNRIPEFTYTGDYDIVNDAGEPISAGQGDWNIRLLTSGNLIFSELKSGIDIFLVGGGGGGAGIGAYPYSNQGSWSGYYWYGNGGGGAGYTKTVKSIAADINTAYAVTIGAGGAAGAAGKNGSDGGASSIVIGATTYSAEGGKAADGRNGGNGGSGGGAGALSSGTESPYCGGAGGTDGGDGVTPTVPTYCQGSAIGSGGTGQGTTTRAFGDASGVLYATGGGGAGGYHSSSGTHGTTGAGGGNNPNTGDGGIGGGQNTTYAGYQTPTAGGSGIIIIRNRRA